MKTPKFYCTQFIEHHCSIKKYQPPDCLQQCSTCMDVIIDHHFDKKKIMSHETENNTTYTVVLDYEGMIDPQIVMSGLDSFDTANYYARKEFSEVTHTNPTVDPSGKYHDSELKIDVWVVKKLRR